MLRKRYLLLLILWVSFATSCSYTSKKDREVSIQSDELCISGIYPHLAYYNNEAECGTGAVVPWAGNLWVITYAPHSPYGSSDKLYQINPSLEITACPESIGGTPASRLIHEESSQLFIGPYAIDDKGNVRAMSYYSAPGRYTGAARHLTDPENKIYIATMEEGFYEVDVKTLETKTLWSDDNVHRRPEGFPILEDNLLGLPGWHGKGLYSGQGVLVYSNNGEQTDEALKRFDIESGSLCEWDGKEWKVVRRNQFTEITSAGGIYGSKKPATDPIWATGWDYKSLLLGVRDAGNWTFYRLPKVSHSYDGAHGWNTEWPRIRNVGTEKETDYLMTMHGAFWSFPQNFTVNNNGGIRPRSAYLKVIGDFTRWGDKLVFGCDDSAEKEFLNTRKAKGDVGGPGQSNSNLWFMDTDAPDTFGPENAGGYVWLREQVNANTPSDPFLFAGWQSRTCWIKNSGKEEAAFTFEIDMKGNNVWTKLKSITVSAGGSAHVDFDATQAGEWIRLISDKTTEASIGFVYGVKDNRTNSSDKIFAGLGTLDDNTTTGALLWGLGQNKRGLGILANNASGETGYYEVDKRMNIVPGNNEEIAAKIRNKYAITFDGVNVEKGSVLILDDAGRRWRLPLGDERYTPLMKDRKLRICREVATERDLFNCHGTFYELPAENADGYAKIRPVSSHNLAINDYASYRGLIIMSGIKEGATDNEHIFRSEDGKAAIWAGAIDDLWKLGKPVGHGGPWVETNVKAGEASDPYLIGYYDKRSVILSHNSTKEVIFTIEVDPTGDGEWVVYKLMNVKSGEKLKHDFPDNVLARWVRVKSDTDTQATAWFEYK